jgi:hypothetical protein
MSLSVVCFWRQHTVPLKLPTKEASTEQLAKQNAVSATCSHTCTCCCCCCCCCCSSAATPVASCVHMGLGANNRRVSSGTPPHNTCACRRCSCCTSAVTPGSAGGGTWWGTLEFVAPEVANHGAVAYSPASDWWGLGVLIYNLLLGLTPWDGESYDERLRQIQTGDVLWPPEGMVSACACCWLLGLGHGWCTAAETFTFARLLLVVFLSASQAWCVLREVLVWGADVQLAAGADAGMARATTSSCDRFKQATCCGHLKAW